MWESLMPLPKYIFVAVSSSVGKLIVSEKLKCCIGYIETLLKKKGGKGKTMIIDE
jgi:hypothetical protein